MFKKGDKVWFIDRVDEKIVNGKIDTIYYENGEYYFDVIYYNGSRLFEQYMNFADLYKTKKKAIHEYINSLKEEPNEKQDEVMEIEGLIDDLEYEYYGYSK